MAARARAPRRNRPAVIPQRAPPKRAGAAAQRRGNDFNFFPSGINGKCNDGNCAFPGAWYK